MIEQNETEHLCIRDVASSDRDAFYGYVNREQYWRDVPLSVRRSTQSNRLSKGPCKSRLPPHVPTIFWQPFVERLVRSLAKRFCGLKAFGTGVVRSDRE